MLALTGSVCVAQAQRNDPDVHQLWSRSLMHNLMSDSVRIMLDQVIVACIVSRDDSIKAEAHHLLGKHYSLIMEEQKARENFYAAKQLYEKNQQWEKTGFALMQIGHCCMQANLLDSALIAYQEANSIYDLHQLKNNSWSAYVGLANVHHKANQVGKAFSYAMKAVEATRSQHDRASKVIALNLMLRLAREHDSTQLIMPYSDELFRLYSPMELDQEKMAHFNYFVHVKDPVRRIALLQTSLEDLMEFSPSLESVSLYNQLALAYVESGNYAAATQTWEYAVSLERDSLQLMQFTPFMLRSLSEMYDHKGDYASALRYFTRYSHIRDSIREVSNEYRMEELQLQYETREKDAALAEQKFVLSRRTAQRNWIVAISLLVLLMGASAFFVQRRHFRDKQTIANQQEKLHSIEIEELHRQHEIQNLHTVITAQEEERKRIAMDLHDSLGGLLATLKIQARHLKEQGDPDRFNSAADEHVHLIDSVSAETRRIAHNMMPPALTRLGLSAAIEDLAHHLQKDKAFEVTFQNIDYDHSLSGDQEITVYRIIQELCANVIRHADAQHVLIQLSRHNGAATVVVEDDGNGFEMYENKDGLGFESIRSRVSLLGGEMEIWSKSGEGTSVTVQIPVI